MVSKTMTSPSGPKEEVRKDKRKHEGETPEEKAERKRRKQEKKEKKEKKERKVAKKEDDSKIAA